MTDSYARPQAIRVATITLSVKGKHLDPARVTAVLGRRPTSTRRPGPAGRWDVDDTWLDYDEPGWWWFSTDTVLPPGASLDDHLRALLGTEQLDAAFWRQVTAESDVQVQICQQGEPDRLPPPVEEVLTLAAPSLRAALRILTTHICSVGVDATSWRHPGPRFPPGSS